MISLCDTCPRPGTCCKNFVLSTEEGPLTFWAGHGIGGPLSYVAMQGLPYIPLEPSDGPWLDPDSGEAFQTWGFGCSNLTPEGRCADYENRPDICRNYAPLQDGMCALHHSRLLPLL